MSETITIDDVRRAGHCVAGAKAWFEAHGFDFRAFLRNGIDAEAMLATGDGQGIQVVERAIARREMARHARPRRALP